MRKLDTASNADGSVRRESCNQEEVTVFYAIEFAEGQIKGTLERIALHDLLPKTKSALSPIARRKNPTSIIQVSQC
jgi:hypothetical protein